MIVEATREHVLGAQVLQAFIRMIPRQGQPPRPLVLHAQNFESRSGNGRIQSLAQIRRRFLAFMDDFQPHAFAFGGQNLQPRRNGGPIAPNLPKPLGGGNRNLPHRGRIAGQFDQADRLLPPRLGKGHGEGRPAVAHIVPAADSLWTVQMAQGDISREIRKDARLHPGQAADVELAGSVALGHAAARREEMPHDDDGRAARRPRRLFGLRQSPGVVAADAGQKPLLLVRAAFSGPCLANVLVAQKGHGADHDLRCALGVAQQQHFLRRIRRGDHMHVQGGQQFLGRGQKGRGVVVPGDDHHMAAARFRDPAEEAVVQFLRPTTGQAAVENVPGNQKRVHPFSRNNVEQPIEKGGEFRVSPPAVQAAAQVPGGSVEDDHGGLGELGDSTSNVTQGAGWANGQTAKFPVWG